MIHARPDYNRIQDPAAEPAIYQWIRRFAEAFRAGHQPSHLLAVVESCPLPVAELEAFAARAELPEAAVPIAVDEPVFLVRAQDECAPGTVRAWAELALVAGASGFIVGLAQHHAGQIDAWQEEHPPKIPDLSLPAFSAPDSAHGPGFRLMTDQMIEEGLTDHPPAVRPQRAEIMRLIREDFDPTPANYEGSAWDDNAEDVADKILDLFPMGSVPPGVTPRDLTIGNLTDETVEFRVVPGEPRFGDRLRKPAKLLGIGTEFSFEERAGHAYAYHEGEFIFRVTTGEQETITDLLRMAYNNGRSSVYREMIESVADAIDRDRDELDASEALRLGKLIMRIEALVEELRYSVIGGHRCDDAPGDPADPGAVREVLDAEDFLARLLKLFTGKEAPRG